MLCFEWKNTLLSYQNCFFFANKFLSFEVYRIWHNFSCKQEHIFWDPKGTSSRGIGKWKNQQETAKYEIPKSLSLGSLEMFDLLTNGTRRRKLITTSTFKYNKDVYTHYSSSMKCYIHYTGASSSSHFSSDYVLFF
mgnify:CR=1 FL=1